MNKKLIMILIITLCFIFPIFSHLCNDVFAKAEDSLAIKVDIRDGQLRINKSGSFKVYLLNSMDRPLNNLQLDVLSDEFDTEVLPSSSWKTYPLLDSIMFGGKKEYFEVKLNRKSNIKEGKYNIKLRLYDSSGAMSKDFKNINIEEMFHASSINEIKNEIKIDGNIDKKEWESSLLCNSFNEFKRVYIDYASSVDKNVKSDIDTRFRFLYDKKRLYCFINLDEIGKEDIAKIFISKDNKTEPKIITIDFNKKEVTTDNKGFSKFFNNLIKNNIKYKFNENKIEMSIPLSILNITNQKSFCMNLSREKNGKISFWKGTEISFEDPIVYTNISLDK